MSSWTTGRSTFSMPQPKRRGVDAERHLFHFATELAERMVRRLSEVRAMTVSGFASGRPRAEEDRNG